MRPGAGLCQDPAGAVSIRSHLRVAVRFLARVAFGAALVALLCLPQCY